MADPVASRTVATASVCKGKINDYGKISEVNMAFRYQRTWIIKFEDFFLHRYRNITRRHPPEPK